jgi:hypothetical protein
MFRLTVVLASLLSAAAFAPVARVARSSSLKMGFENEIGVQRPLGFWDPLNLLKDADQDRFDRLRTVETKHGRISMLAILGHLVTTAGYRLPGNISYDLKFKDIPTGIKALEAIPFAGVCQIIAFIGLIELGFNSRKEEIEEAQFEVSALADFDNTPSMARELLPVHRVLARKASANPFYSHHHHILFFFRCFPFTGVWLGRGHLHQEAGHRAQQRPCCPDGHPRPHGTREA